MATLHLPARPVAKPPPAKLTKGPAATKSAERKRPTKEALLKAGLTMRDVQTTMSTLFERFPEVFRPKRRPLAINIHHAIRAACPDIHPIALALALHEWCTHPLYHKSIIEKQHRHNLDGSDAADITEAEREHARTQLELLRAQRETQRAADARVAA
jgi:sRNA-binding protein